MIENFEPIVEIGRLPMVLVARKGLQVKSAADLTKVARSAPGKITYGTWGVGSVAHLAFAMLEKQAGVELNHVPLQGGAPTYAAVLGGHVDLAARSQLAAGGIEPSGGTPTQLAERQRDDISSWGKVIKEKNIRINELQ